VPRIFPELYGVDALFDSRLDINRRAASLLCLSVFFATPLIICLAIVEKIKNANTPFYRPALPQQESEGVHPGILTLMKECWAEEPPKRPPFTEIAKAIRTINRGKSVFLPLQYILMLVGVNKRM